MKSLQKTILIIFSVIFLVAMPILAQGVTTANINGLVQSTEGESLIAANVIVVHEPSGTQYGASTNSDGRFFLPNLKIGGPYIVTVSYVGYNSQVRKNINLKIGQKLNLNFILVSKSVKLGEVVIVGKKYEIINSGRTGAETFIDPASVQEMPSIKRSTRDLTRLDPRSDGNFSFGGKNWLFNNVSVDGRHTKAQVFSDIRNAPEVSHRISPELTSISEKESEKESRLGSALNSLVSGR